MEKFGSKIGNVGRIFQLAESIIAMLKLFSRLAALAMNINKDPSV
jgi:hypothetical protein